MAHEIGCGAVDHAIDVIRNGIMRGQLGADRANVIAFYDKHGASPDTVAAAVLDAIAHPQLVVVSPRSQVLAPYLLHRLSPRLMQPLARSLTKTVSRG